jgi:hypothetical protein
MANDHLDVKVDVLVVPEEEYRWIILVTPVSAEPCSDGEVFQTDQEPYMTVEPGCHELKNPAAISPVLLEHPHRVAGLARLMVGDLLVYSLIQRRVRLYLITQDQQVPAIPGETATPAAAAVFPLFPRVALGHVRMGH